MTETISGAATSRSQAKADRRQTLLDAAARLFAEHGFGGVSMEDLGAAAGVSGPAVYRHFPGKQAVLGALLVGVSENLLRGGKEQVADASDATSALHALVRFHVEFALRNPDIIRAQDRDLAHLTDADRIAVRSLQRRYVELWVQVLSDLRSEDLATLRVRAHAVFGLINSTPYSTRAHGVASRPPLHVVGDLLEGMALAALLPA
jgi:Transcriptional regulator